MGYRPNPIVRMGLFMARKGMPIAFCINPHNTTETKILVPIEKKLDADFRIPDSLICINTGLSELSNRRFNNCKGRHVITVQSLKARKISPHLQQRALDPEGWHVIGQNNTVPLFTDEFDKDLYKERRIAETVSSNATQTHTRKNTLYISAHSVSSRLAVRSGQSATGLRDAG